MHIGNEKESSPLSCNISFSDPQKLTIGGEILLGGGSENDVRCQNEHENSLILLKSVPSFMIISDILHYFNNVISNIVTMHIIKSHYSGYSTEACNTSAFDNKHPNHYMCLIQTKSKRTAVELIKYHNSRVISSIIEPTICELYYVKSVYFHVPNVISESRTVTPAAFSNSNANTDRRTHRSSSSSNLFPLIKSKFYRFHNAVDSHAISNEEQLKGRVSTHSKDEMLPDMHTDPYQLNDCLLFYSDKYEANGFIAKDVESTRDCDKYEANGFIAKDMESTRDCDQLCTLCLEGIPSVPCTACADGDTAEINPAHCSLTTYCNHAFHISCLVKDVVKCPMCRYEHEATSLDSNGSVHRNTSSYSCCMVCGWRNAQDHVLEETSEKLSTVQSEPNLTQALSSAANTNTNTNPNHDCMSSSSSDIGNSSLWCCLICGFIGCGIDHNNDILAHYQDTLHTYAINLNNKHVWDFAGGGYVSRVGFAINAEEERDDHDTLNRVDTLNGSDSVCLASPKVVAFDCTHTNNVNNVHVLTNSNSHAVNAHPYRSLAPVYLSDEIENRIVNQELETAARQFQYIYAMQLNQSRLHYQNQLSKLHEHMYQEGILAPKNANINVHADDALVDDELECGLQKDVGANKNWNKQILNSITNEKKNLQKMVDSVKSKLSQAKKEIDILDRFNQSLETNISVIRRDVDEALIRLSHEEADHRVRLLRLEQELESKMKLLSS